ncbi:MAG TPA: glycosyl transferase family 1, partial [Mizugakiibacter sp.]|nr:glycosyl transferase family 1 [Mizugakiibacter sp.]
MKTVQIIARDNGWGLSRDLSLLAAALQECGHGVSITALRRGKLRKWLRPFGVRLAHWARHSIGRSEHFDFNLMVERIRPEYFAEADRNLLLPNPEWFADEDRPWLSRLDGVLAKTRHAERIFRELGCTVHWVGFRSEDRLDRAVPRETRFFHLAGRSENKGTQ